MRAGLEDFFWDSFIALQLNGISGDYVEFGSWGGNTIHAAHEAVSALGQPRHLWAFDSFDVLPDSTDPRDERWKMAGPGFGGNGVQEFHDTCAQNGVPRHAYTAVEGYFEETLPPLGTGGAPANIALAYVDCNMYVSTVTVLEFLLPRMKHGMIIGFDDYYCWSPNHVSAERAALHEFLVANPEWNFCRFKDIHWCGIGFVVEKAGELPTLGADRIAN